MLPSRRFLQLILRRTLTTAVPSNTPQQVLLEHLHPSSEDDRRFAPAATTTNNACDHHDPEEGGATVALITLNRPEAANAMGKLFLDQFHAILEELQQAHGTTRCVVVASASPKVFSAGADLKERQTLTMDETEAFVTRLRCTFEDLANLSVPTIAAIEGVAVGGGLELALATDLRIASTKAILGLPETTLAIVPGAGGTQRLSRLVGLGRAKELIFTGRRFDGVTAYEYGLVQRVVEPGNTRTAALEWAWTIAANGPVAIRAAKFAMDEGMSRTTVAEALEVERQAYRQVLTTEDRLEGLRAFQEKRPPVYRGH